MRILFTHANALFFRPGIEDLLDEPHEIEALTGEEAQARPEALADADVLVTTTIKPPVPPLDRLRLVQVPAAGLDALDFNLIPERAAIANCFGHEPPIAEYCLFAMLNWVVPALSADRALREGRWIGSAHGAGDLHGELGGRTLGLVGFGHIGREIARKARAFDMRVIAANRSPVADTPLLDKTFGLGELERMMAESDVVVAALPLTAETEGLIGARAFAAMAEGGLFINVGRGPVVDETALFEAVKTARIHAAIDTWYLYPSADQPTTHPSRHPFHELDNVLMTPHMSAWTTGTIRRRQQTIATNINRLETGEPLENLVRAPA